MKFSIRYADQIVGTLIVLGLVILVAVILMLGRSQRWFIRDNEYITYFNSAQGISPNMAITYKGFTMGYVKKIMLADDDRVEVLFTIFAENNHRVREGSVVELIASPIGLGNSFQFYPGKGTRILEEGSVIPEINSREARDLVSQGLVERPETSDSINSIINHINSLLEIINISLAGSQGSDDLAIGQIIANLNKTTADISDLVNSITNQIDPIFANLETITGDIQDQITPIISNIETFTDQLIEPSGTVMSILDGEGPVYRDLTNSLESIAGILKGLESVTDFVPTQLPQIAVLISNLQSTLTEAEKLVISLLNNPLLRGGVPETREAGPGTATPRNLEF